MHEVSTHVFPMLQWGVAPFSSFAIVHHPKATKPMSSRPHHVGHITTRMHFRSYDGNILSKSYISPIPSLYTPVGSTFWHSAPSVSCKMPEGRQCAVVGGAQDHGELVSKVNLLYLFILFWLPYLNVVPPIFHRNCFSKSHCIGPNDTRDMFSVIMQICVWVLKTSFLAVAVSCPGWDVLSRIPNAFYP